MSRYAPLAAIQASFINTSNYVYFEEYTTKTAVIAKVDDILFEANDTQTPSVPSIEVEYNLQVITYISTGKLTTVHHVLPRESANLYL